MPTSTSAALSAFELNAKADWQTNALPLARLAKLAYAPPLSHEDRESHERFPDLPLFWDAFPLVRTFGKGAVEGFVAANDADVIVAIRGYQNPDRWIEAIPFAQVPGFGGYVSEGVKTNARAVWDSVLAGFFDANVGEKTLWLTGHSVGGAVVTVLAAELDAEGFDIASAYSFGAPAVFDQDAADAFRPTLHRVVNDGDWIPELQWPRIARPYVHTGHRHLLLRSGAVGSGRYPDHLARRIDRFMNIETPMDYGGAIEDHRADEYIRRLRSFNAQN